MKYLLIIHNSGSYIKVTGLQTENDSFEVDTTKYIEVTEELYNFVGTVDLAINTVKYPTGTTELTKEILITNSPNVFDNVENVDTLSIIKLKSIQQAKNELLTRVDFTTLMDYHTFTIINNELILAGYTIIDSNREEKYLEIINTSDSELISKLEKYLEAYDRLSQHRSWYLIYTKTISQINSATTTSEVEGFLNTYLEQFF